MTDTPELNEAADGGLRTTDLFVGLRVRYENMEGEVEANPDYNPYANMEDYASGRLPSKCIYKWVVRSGTDGFYPESVLAHGGKLSPTNIIHHSPLTTLSTMTTYRPYSLESTLPRRRKCYPMLIIYHVGRIVAILATLAIVGLCLGAM